MESVPVTAPFDEIPAKFAHYLTSVDTQRLDHWLMAGLTGLRNIIE